MYIIILCSFECVYITVFVYLILSPPLSLSPSLISRLSVETTSTVTSHKHPRKKVLTKKKVPRVSGEKLSYSHTAKYLNTQSFSFNNRHDFSLSLSLSLSPRACP